MRRLVVGVLGFVLAPGLALSEEQGARWQSADGPYLEAAHGPVHRRWSGFLRELSRLPASSPYRQPGLSAELLVAVAADGRIAHVERTRGSGLQGFDDAPVELMQDVAQLPPPPPALRSDDGRTYLRWRFVAQDPGCEERAVIERRLPAAEAVRQMARDGRVVEAARRAAEALREDPRGEAELLRGLVTALGPAEAQSEESTRRAAAAPLLAQLAEGGAPLLTLARDGDPAVRRAALMALGRRPRRPEEDATVREVLMKALAGAEADAAAEALGRRKEREAAGALRSVLESGRAPREAARALVELGEREAAVLGARKLLGGPAALQRLGAEAARTLRAPELLSDVVELLGRSPSDVEARVALVEALGVPRAPAEARKALLAALRDPVPAVRGKALETLAETGERPSAVRARAEEALADPSVEMRAAAAAALVAVGAVDELFRPARDRSPLVRRALALALRAHPTPGARKLLDRLAQDPDPTVRAAAADEAASGSPDRARLTQQLLAAREPVALLQAAARWLAAAESSGP